MVIYTDGAAGTWHVVSTHSKLDAVVVRLVKLTSL